mgnify:CR=1 FL=1
MAAVLVFMLFSGILHNHFREENCCAEDFGYQIRTLSAEANHHCNQCDLLLLASSIVLTTLGLLSSAHKYISSLFLSNSELIPSVLHAGAGSRSPPSSLS